jgi:hypothetical protein
LIAAILECREEHGHIFFIFFSKQDDAFEVLLNLKKRNRPITKPEFVDLCKSRGIPPSAANQNLNADGRFAFDPQHIKNSQYLLMWP